MDFNNKSRKQFEEEKSLTKTIEMHSISTSRLALSILFIVLIKLSDTHSQVEAGNKGGDDIILAKGKLIMRGHKEKGELNCK